MFYNIKQLTLADMTEAETRERTVHIGGEKGRDVILDYYIITNAMLQKTSSSGTTVYITKLGFCANSNEGKDYPIYLYFDGDSSNPTQIYLGKDGMYEFQNEMWKDINSEEGSPEQEEQEMKVNLTSLEVPISFDFCLDYCYLI